MERERVRGCGAVVRPLRGSGCHGPVRLVPIPAPTLVLRLQSDGSLPPMPRQERLRGYQRPALRPRCAPRPATAPAPAPPTPAGMRTVQDLAAELAVPAPVLRHWARRAPDRLPPFVLVAGEPFFPPAAR